MDKQGMLSIMLLVLQEDLKSHNYFEKNEINLEKIWEDRLSIRENITKKISQLTELELGKAFNKYSFSFKNSKEYESKLELQKGIDYKGPPFSDEKTFEEHF